MQSGGRITTKIYYCGSCANNFGRAYKNVQSGERQIPARAVLFEHNGDFYLFDTGYARRVFENGWMSKLYNRLNPVTVSECDSIAFQLERDGITDIKGIILSHLHPDHIGGLLDFPQSKIFISKGTYSTYKKRRLMDLIFDNMLPTDFEERVTVLDIEGDYDFFGDGSVILKDVSGHTIGQTGMFLPEQNTFYAADSCWAAELTDKAMRFTGRFIQKDYIMYQKTIEKIKRMQSDGVRVVFSHEVCDE